MEWLVGLIVLAVVVIVGMAIRTAVSKGRELTAFDGVAPGIIPANPNAHPTTKVKARELLPDPPPPRFNPPELLMPWMAGSVLPRGIGGRDVGALLVDLAVAGYLRIDKDPAASAKRKKEKSDWILTRTAKPVSHLTGAPRDMMMLVFPQGEPGEATGMDAVRRRGSGTAGRAVRTAILTDTTRTLGFAPTQDHAVRTALRAQTGQFHQYLRTAEASQIKVDEAASIFSRYLPWAIALGEAEHWAKVFRDVAEGLGDGGFTSTDAIILSSWGNDLAWFGGFAASGFDVGGFDAGALGAGAIDLGGIGNLGIDFTSFSDSIGSFGDSISDVGSSFDSFSGDFGGSSGGDGGGSSWSCGSSSSCGSSCGGGGGCGSS